MSDMATLDVSPAACVARGTEWLDAVAPGWATQIDLEMLDLTSGNACVFGQVFDDGWSDGIRRLGADNFGTVDPAIVAVAQPRTPCCEGCDSSMVTESITRHLGVMRFEESSNGLLLSWQPLEDEWRRVITERQAQPV